MAYQQPNPIYSYPVGTSHLLPLIQSNARLFYGRRRIYDVVLMRSGHESHSERGLLIGYSLSHTTTGKNGAIDIVNSKGTVLREARLKNGGLFSDGSQVSDISNVLLSRLLYELQMELGDVLPYGLEQLVVGHCFEGDAGLQEDSGKRFL